MDDAGITIVVAAFAASHLLAPRAFGWRQQWRQIVTSFAGGLAMAYVCLHLIPEIDAASHVLGRRIYFLVMVGFAAYYGLEILFHRQLQREDARWSDHALNVALVAIYNFLLVYTLAHQMPPTAFLAAGFALMIGLHLLMTDFGLLEQFEQAFTRQGRFVLLASVLLGWLLTSAGEPEEQWVDVFTALLAGSMMYKVFRNELPAFRQAHYGAFLGGLGLFFVTHEVLQIA